MRKIKDETDFAEKRAELRKAYKKAVEEGKEEFIFEGHPVMTRYIKYLIEHIDDISKA